MDFPSPALFSCSSLPLLFQPRQSGLQTFRPFGTESGELKFRMKIILRLYLLDVSHVPLESNRGGECCKLSGCTSVCFVSTHPARRTHGCDPYHSHSPFPDPVVAETSDGQNEYENTKHDADDDPCACTVGLLLINVRWCARCPWRCAWCGRWPA